MSANNQTLVKEYKGKFYVFENIQAESWCVLDENNKIIDGRDNELSLKSAVAVFESRDEAFEKAREVDRQDYFSGTEYGIQFDKLFKDGAEVKIIE